MLQFQIECLHSIELPTRSRHPIDFYVRSEDMN